MLVKAKNFVLNGRVTPKEILENVTFYGKKFPRRFMFVKLRKYIGEFLTDKALEPRMIGIAGIRGVGKTTILWQVADFVRENYPEVSVYFLSMDIASDYGFESSDLIEALKETISPSEKVVFLFDEIQYLGNWSLFLKIVYDIFKNAFILATGSSSLLIHSTVDLSTRWNVESLYPLSFTEFVMIKSWLKRKGTRSVFPEKSLGEQIKNALFHSESVEEVAKKLSRLERKISNYYVKVEAIKIPGRWRGYVKEYIFYHNIPRLLFVEEENTVINRAFDLLHRVLYQDLREFYEENDIGKIRRFLVLLAFSDELNKEKMSQSLGIKVEKLERVLDSLVKSELLLKFPAYGGVKTRAKKEKIFFISPTIRYSIIKQLLSNSEQFYSKLYEDIVALYLRKNFNGLVLYGGREGTRSPDFVIDLGDKVIPVEVGVGKRDLSQLEVVEEKKYGLLISFKAEKVVISRDSVIVPLKWFLLM